MVEAEVGVECFPSVAGYIVAEGIVVAGDIVVADIRVADNDVVDIVAGGIVETVWVLVVEVREVSVAAE